MADVLNVSMLVCASVGSMAFGVLSAYGIFRAAFALMQPRPRVAPAKAQSEAAL
jgi:predicted Fe-Mo cluster-binding NifX family protein